MYIYYYFFFLAFSTIRYDWPGLLICYPRLSLLLFVARFLDRFSIPTPSTSSLCGETQRGTTFVENRDLLYVLFTQRVKFATNKRTKFSIQTFYSSATTVFKSDKVYFWLLLDEIDEIVPCCFSQMRIDRRLLLRYSRISTTVAIRSSRSGRARITATIVSLCFFIVVVGCFQNLDEQLWRSFWTRWI